MGLPKFYISADIEGIAGATTREDVFPGGASYEEMRRRMTAHVAAVCEGAQRVTACDILVRDAHGSSSNIVAEELPRSARLLRGWAFDPMMMVQGLDSSFDAVIMVGYHSRAGSEGNPLAHTMSGSRIALLEIDDRPIGEFELYGWAAGLVGVPVALVSGDEELCRSVRELNEHIRTVPVMEGVGASTVSIHPDDAAERLLRGTEAALDRDLSGCLLPVPEAPVMRIRFKELPQAMKAGFYPGAERIDDYTVELRTRDYSEVLAAMLFFSGV